jgi:hypothetical protein
MHKQMFKVVCPIEKKDGTGTFWGRAGTAYRNKDESINIYLDFLPTNGKLQLRELTEEDLREREGKRASYGNRASMATLPATAQEPIPF